MLWFTDVTCKSTLSPWYEGGKISSVIKNFWNNLIPDIPSISKLKLNGKKNGESNCGSSAAVASVKIPNNKSAWVILCDFKDTQFSSTKFKLLYIPSNKVIPSPTILVLKFSLACSCGDFSSPPVSLFDGDDSFSGIILSFNPAL